MCRLRSGLFVAWGSAWLAGRASYDDVVVQVTGADEPHRVQGLPDSPDAPLGWALTALRSRDADALRLVLPVPGDPRGLPAGSDFAAEALRAGEAVIGGGLGLVPDVQERGSTVGSRAIVVVWRAFAIDEPRPDPLPLADAEHDLTEALREAATALTDLDVATWRPELAEAAAGIRNGAARLHLPAGYDPRALRLLAQADRLAAVLDLAHDDAPGGAVTSQEATRRAEILRPLATAIRRARLAAYNAVTADRR